MAYVSQEDKAKLAPEIKKVLSKYGMKGSISVRHHSTLVVTLQSGSIDFGEYTHGDGYIQVNTYHIESHYRGKAKAFLTELLAAMKGPDYFNNDDAMTDYFHRSHYTDINVGKWNKPYFLQTPKKAAVKTSKEVVGTEIIAPICESAEAVACMNLTQREKFVKDMVSRYPNLADQLMSDIGYELMDKERTIN
tara:strand:+ start:1011 stop:1586 length:576 start_codon:yes stop_codon:yes gene_type:complete